MDVSFQLQQGNIIVHRKCMMVLFMKYHIFHTKPLLPTIHYSLVILAHYGLHNTQELSIQTQTYRMQSNHLSCIFTLLTMNLNSMNLVVITQCSKVNLHISPHIIHTVCSNV